MFSIIVSEKGGAERREHYDRTEISVGRVQGNELMLPKGNVSKRHARLLYRDGRFIVTDLKSTNGTYINGRKITQATIVREGDKIYIGDFILRIDPDPSLAAASAIRSSEDSGSEPAPELPVESSSEASRPMAPLRAEATASRPAGELISHFPLEHDPDESVPQVAVPGPPRIPAAPRVAGLGTPRPPLGLSGPSTPHMASHPSPLGRPAMPQMPVIPQGPALSAGAVASQGPLGAGRRAIPPPLRADGPTASPSQLVLHRSALSTVVERVLALPELAPLLHGAIASDELTRRVDAAIPEQLEKLRAAGELAADVDVEALSVDVRREVLELGPLGPLLDDEDVSEIQVVRHDYVVAMNGRRNVAADVVFTSEAAVARVLARLCASSGQPLGPSETYVERRLPRGQRLLAVCPPAASHGHMVVLRKPQRADLSLDDLVRSGTISRAMATLLATCVTARANVLVVGALGSGATSFLGALAGAGSVDDRVVLLQEDDELILSQPHTVSLLVEGGAEAARALAAATRAHPDRLVVGSFAGHLAAEVVDAIGDGIDGVLAAGRSPTLRHALARLPADIAATRAGLSVETSREWLASAFDLVVEVARLRDGRHRVMRVADLALEGGVLTPRDVFTFAVERTAAGGALEGTFYATGHVPRIVEDMTARGVVVDSALFKRSPTR
jgi:pilus assembly protein CpaF